MEFVMRIKENPRFKEKLKNNKISPQNYRIQMNSNAILIYLVLCFMFVAMKSR